MKEDDFFSFLEGLVFSAVWTTCPVMSLRATFVDALRLAAAEVVSNLMLEMLELPAEMLCRWFSSM